MEPVIDETSLVPCTSKSPSERISELASVLVSLDRFGVRRNLRSVADAVDRNIAQELGLRHWCFDKNTNREAGRLVASRLSRQPPFIDGPDGIFAKAEGSRVLETRVNGTVVYGLGLGALEGRLVVALAGNIKSAGPSVDVQIIDASDDELITSTTSIVVYTHRSEVEGNATQVQELVDDSLRNGVLLLERFPEIFPQLRLGIRASEAIRQLTGSEPVYRQLLRHLRALNAEALSWQNGANFTPQGITFSPESTQTLENGKFGPLRDFPTPDGFPHERWSLHTKLTGGDGARLYYRPILTPECKVVLIGYFGPHLACVRFPK